MTFGSSEAAVRAEFGEPGGGQGFFPTDEDSFRGPASIPAVGGAKRLLLRYEEVAFLVAAKEGVYALTVTRLDAKTSAGVGVGDPLERVRDRYNDVQCGENVAGEALFGGETPCIRGAAPALAGSRSSSETTRSRASH